MRIVFILFLVLLGSRAQAQVDITSWTSVQLDYIANDKLTLKLKPIQRQRNDLSEYDNTSIDFITAYKFGNGWSGGILKRYFFIPDQDDLEFIFFDLKKTVPLGQFTFTNLVRYHLVKGDGNRNFLRYHPILTYQLNDRWTPFVNLELWTTTDISKFVGARYSGGVKYKINSDLGAQLFYWRQAGYSDAPIGSNHNFLFNLQYILRHKTAS